MLVLGVLGSIISIEVWLWNVSSSGGISKHSGVEEYNNFKLFDSSCNCALIGGDLSSLMVELLFSLSMFLPGNMWSDQLKRTTIIVYSISF